MSLIGVAIAMAVQQEAHPSGAQRDIHTVITLGSASQWGLCELDLFQVHFEKDKFDALPDVVLAFIPPDDVAKLGINILQGEDMTGAKDILVSEEEEERKRQLDDC